MRINKKSSGGKRVTIIILILLAVGLTCAALYASPSLLNKPEQAQREKEQKKAQQQSNSQKKQYIENKGTTQTEAPQTPPTSSDSIVISAEKINNGSVTIYTKLYGFSAGICELSILNSAKSYSKSAGVIYQPEYSTCAGFSVPFSELGSGTWEITLKVTPSNGTQITKLYKKEF